MDRHVVAVDVGGTFTDCVAWDGTEVTVAKLSSTADQSDAVMTGARRVTAGSRAASLLHGSTVATNALLEGQGAAVALVTDAGFEDVIEIGRQDRPSLYDSFADRPPPLVARDARVGFSGDVDAVRRSLDELSFDAVAVSLAYSFTDPSAEDQIAGAVSHLDVPVSVSSRVVPEFREFERTSTTVLNAYLMPVVGRYLRRLDASAATVSDLVQMMRSSGGLMDLDAAAELPAALLLSGPAGGVVAAAELGRHHGRERVIAFDMGGTSTDVCRIEGGRPEVAYERTVDGYVCRMPSVAVHTVGAGGGSMGWVDAGGSLRVGPQSAGAEPGPASYGRGGTAATVTDAHVALGRIDPATPLGGELNVDRAAAVAALERLGFEAGLGIDATAAGIVEVVDAHMERAIRAVSVEQGADPRAAALVAFGGAGGLHATGLAKRLDMAATLIPPFAGVFSAVGLLMAPPRFDLARSLLIRPDRSSELASATRTLVADAVATFRRAHGTAPSRADRVLDMRYVGQAHEIAVPIGEGERFEDAVTTFHRLHAEMNGFARPDDPVEAVTVRVVVQGQPLMTWSDLPRRSPPSKPEPRHRPVVMGDAEVEAATWWRPDLPTGMELKGPAVITEPTGTTVLEPGDTAGVLDDGTLEVTW